MREWGVGGMTPAEIELVRYAIDEITRAWFLGAVAIGIGIGSISVKNIIGKGEK